MRLPLLLRGGGNSWVFCPLLLALRAFLYALEQPSTLSESIRTCILEATIRTYKMSSAGQDVRALTSSVRPVQTRGDLVLDNFRKCPCNIEAYVCGRGGNVKEDLGQGLFLTVPPPLKKGLPKEARREKSFWSCGY